MRGKRPGFRPEKRKTEGPLYVLKRAFGHFKLWRSAYMDPFGFQAAGSIRVKGWLVIVLVVVVAVLLKLLL